MNSSEQKEQKVFGFTFWHILFACFVTLCVTVVFLHLIRYMSPITSEGYLGLIATLIGVMITIAIGFQIYNAIDVKKNMDLVKKDYTDKIKVYDDKIKQIDILEYKLKIESNISLIQNNRQSLYKYEIKDYGDRTGFDVNSIAFFKLINIKSILEILEHQEKIKTIGQNKIVYDGYMHSDSNIKHELFHYSIDMLTALGIEKDWNFKNYKLLIQYHELKKIYKYDNLYINFFIKEFDLLKDDSSRDDVRLTLGKIIEILQ